MAEKEYIKGVVLPTKHVSWLSPKGWTPTQQDIDSAIPEIINYIKESNQRIYSNLNKYRCQFFGIYVNGKRRIYCNFFYLSEFTQDWQAKAVIVQDGGDWYFQLEYDPETKKCMNFYVNGEA